MSLSVVTANEFISDKSLLTAKAADFTYPVHEFRIAVSDTNRNLNIYSSEEGAYLISDTNQNVNVSGTRLKPEVQNGTNTEKWSLNFVSDNVFKIVSAESGNIQQ